MSLGEEGRREMLEVINSEVDRLNHLVEGLIEMAKIEAGAMEPRRSWSNVEEIVSIALARSNNFLKQHRVRMELEDDLPPVRVDEKAMAEVIYVLLENASKYSPTNTAITVSAAKSGKESIQISVEDQGSGIPQDFRERVFEKFFRLSEPSLQ